MMKYIVIVLAVLLLSSCASTSRQTSTGPTGTSEPTTEEVPAEVVPKHTAVVDELLTQARLQYRHGEYQYAIRTAERGMRIERSRSDWYIILAESYLKLGSPANAQQFARLGLRYTRASGRHFKRLKAIATGKH